VRVADLEVDELLAGELSFDRGRSVFDAGTETDADEAQDGAMTFADAEDVVLEVSAGGS